MKLLLITDRFWPEVRSSAHLFHELARELTRRGHQVTVVTRMPTEYLSASAQALAPGWSSVDGITVLRLAARVTRSGRPLFRAVDQLTFRWTLDRALRQVSPHMDAALVYSPPLPLAASAARYGERTGCPFVLNVQDLYPQTAIDLGLLKNRLLVHLAERMESRAYEAATRIVVHSAGNRGFLQARKGLGDKVRVIHNWVDLDALRPGERRNDFRRRLNLGDRFVVSYAGVLGYAQDLRPVLDCAARMTADDDVLFLLVGDGVLRERWTSLAAHLGNVMFLPMQSKDVYAELLAASDVCVVPLDETLTTPVVPGKLQSIMAAGRPAIGIAPPGGDMPKMLEASGAGVCIPPSDAGSMIDILRSLKANPEMRREMGSRGRRYAESHFSLEQAADEYEGLFLELKGERRDPRDR